MGGGRRPLEAARVEFVETPAQVGPTSYPESMSHEHKTLPIDAASTATLAVNNLRMTLIDTSDTPVFAAWVEAANRGFHGGPQPEEKAAAFMATMAERRNTGVFDGEAVVATTNAFASPVTLPGGREIPAWAISMVTVAQTHRRRGIARELLQSELRAAVALGIPLAILTVSESTIYGRFGFAPATMASTISIDTRKARFTGPTPDGTVRFIDLEELRPIVDELYATARLASAGEIAVWSKRWDQILGIQDEEKDVSKRPRAVLYRDAAGAAQGFAIYKLKENESDFTAHTAQLEYLLANTPDAYAALWRFLLELDLTATVTAQLRPVDEPVRWMINDFRAAKVETYDHLWTRILDVKACLEARAYFAPIDLVLEVTDQLGHAAGTYRLAAGQVELVETQPALTMSINELSAIYLGGVSATTLHAAGRIVEHAPGALAELDAAFRSPQTPWLSVWF